MLGPFSLLLFQIVKYGPLVYVVIAYNYLREGETTMFYVFLALQTYATWQSIDSDAPTYRMPSRRWGPFRQEFYSICSAHYHNDPSCPRCRAGAWKNVWGTAFSLFVFKVSPERWQWWQNKLIPRWYRMLHRLGLR
jgi:hypothetical protein